MARPGRPTSESDEDRDQRLSRALYEIGALWQRVRNLKRDKADTSHDHDGRYVNESGDTMSGHLDFGGQRIEEQSAGASTERLEARSSDDGTIIRLFVTGQGRDDSDVSGFEVRIDSGSGIASVFAVKGDGNVVVQNDFDVNGSKNARIVDPDDPTRAFRFAAVEADEPGLLIHRRTVTIPEGNGGEATVDLPSHWLRIAKDGDAMVTPRDDTRDQAPAAAVVDLTVPEVTVRGRPGDYRVWVMAARADAGVRGWTHEVEVTPDDEDEDDTAP